MLLTLVALVASQEAMPVVALRLKVSIFRAFRMEVELVALARSLKTSLVEVLQAEAGLVDVSNRLIPKQMLVLICILLCWVAT